MRIESLTSEQEELLDVYHDKWLRNGLDTKPMDIEKATRGIALIYKAGDLPPPQHVLVTDSPMSCGVIQVLLETHGESLLDAKPIPCEPLQLRSKFWTSIMESAVRSFGLAEGRARQLLNKMLKSKTIALKQLGDVVQAQIFASHNAGWVAWMTYCRDVLGIDIPEAEGWVSVAEEVGWLAGYENVVILQHKHESIKTDDQGRLHCEDGPAFCYRDGFSGYFWHGQAVSERVILNPESITLDDIKGESNAEIARVMRERYGDGRYLKDIGAKVIDVDYEGVAQGAAPRCLLEDDRKERWLVGTDGSTGRVYYMLAPAEATTCREAHEAIAGFDESNIIAKS